MDGSEGVEVDYHSIPGISGMWPSTNATTTSNGGGRPCHPTVIPESGVSSFSAGSRLLCPAPDHFDERPSHGAQHYGDPCHNGTGTK